MSHIERIGEIGSKNPITPAISEATVILDVDGSPLETGVEPSANSFDNFYVPKTYSPMPEDRERSLARIDSQNLYPVTLPTGYVYDIQGYPYRLGDDIAHTPNSRVVRGDNMETGDAVVLKFTDAHRARREKSNLVNLASNPNVVSINGGGIVDNTGSENVNALITEFIQGRTLREFIPDSPEEAGMNGFGEVVDAVLDSVNVVRAIHQQGRVVRDYKPSNVMRVDFSGRGVMLDAEAIEREGLVADNITGTLDLMPAEALKNEGLRHESDVYAVGLTVGMLIVGRCGSLARDSTARIDEIHREVRLQELEKGKLPIDLSRVHRLAPAPLAEAIDASADPDPNSRADLKLMIDALQDAREALRAA